MRPGTSAVILARIGTLIVILSTVLVTGAVLALFSMTKSTAAAHAASVDEVAASARASIGAQRVLEYVLGVTTSQHRKSIAREHADLLDASNNLDATIAELQAAPSSPAVAAHVQSLSVQWAPIRQQIALYTDDLSHRDPAGVVDALTHFGPSVSASLDEIRFDVSAANDTTEKTAESSRRLVSIGAMAALALLVVGLMIRFGAAAQSRSELSATQPQLAPVFIAPAPAPAPPPPATSPGHDAALLLDSANYRMFALDRNQRVCEPFSKRLGELFDAPDVEGRSMRELLEPLASPKSIATVDEILRRMFDDATAGDPDNDRFIVREVELTRDADPDRSASYVDVSFRRVRDGAGSVSAVYVSIDDVYERVRINRELRDTKRVEERYRALLDLLSRMPLANVEKFLAQSLSLVRQMSVFLQAEDFGYVERGHDSILIRKVDNVRGAVAELVTICDANGFDYITALGRSYAEHLAAYRLSALHDGDAFARAMEMQAALRAEIEQLDVFRFRFARMAS